MTTLGSCPGSVEESAPVSDAVVAIQDRVGDHAGPGEQLTPYELTGEQCVELAELLRSTSLFLGDAYGGYAARLRTWADTLTEVAE